MLQLLFIAMFSSAICQAETKSNELYQKIKEASFSILSNTQINGWITRKTVPTVGSGFLVEGGYIMSAYHVIEGAVKNKTPLQCFHNHNEVNSLIFEAKAMERVKKEAFRCRVAKVVPELDIAFLQVVDQKAIDHINFLRIYEGKVFASQRVYGVASPSGFAGTWFEGYVNNIVKPFTISGLNPKFNAKEYFLYTTPILGGASGGVVCNEEGEVIGLTFATVFGLNFGVAVPSYLFYDIVAELSKDQTP